MNFFNLNRVFGMFILTIDCITINKIKFIRNHVDDSLNPYQHSSYLIWLSQKKNIFFFVSKVIK